MYDKKLTRPFEILKLYNAKPLPQVSSGERGGSINMDTNICTIKNNSPDTFFLLGHNDPRRIINLSSSLNPYSHS